MLSENHLNPTKLGRLMAAIDGDPEKADSRRAQVSKWLRPRLDVPGEHGTISDDNARLIVDAINAERKRRAQLPLYDRDYLVKPKPRRNSLDELAEEIMRLRRRQDELEAEIKHLRNSA